MKEAIHNSMDQIFENLPPKLQAKLSLMMLTVGSGAEAFDQLTAEEQAIIEQTVEVTIGVQAGKGV